MEATTPNQPNSTGRLLLASASAGVIATALTHPLDTWAVHRMLNRPVELKLSVLYRGVGPACLQSAAMYGAMLGSFGYCREHLGWSMLISAMVSAVPESLVKGPLETLKNVRQIGGVGSVPLRLMARGTLGMLAREIPGNVAYFGSYELVRGTPKEVEVWKNDEGRRAEEAVHTMSIASLSRSPFIAGVAAATAFTALVYPIDAMRAQMIVNNVPLTPAGLATLRPTYRGALPYLTRVVFLTGFLFSTFEYMRG